MADIHHTSHSTSYSTSHTPHGRYKVHVTGSDDQVSSPHCLEHLTSVSDRKHSVSYDEITHTPSVSSISTEFVVHNGPNNMQIPVSTAIGSTDKYIQPIPGKYETEYEHAFASPSRTTRTYSLHKVDEESEGNTLPGRHHHCPSDPVPLGNTLRRPSQSATTIALRPEEVDNCWSDMDEALSGLLKMYAYEKTWIGLALDSIKNRKYDPAVDYAFVRVREKKSDCGEKLEKDKFKSKDLQMTLREKTDLEEKIKLYDAFLNACRLIHSLDTHK